ncbi:MAG: 50S ribosomal protein L25 [Planctomycetia bacterium]|nr:50S ribosomal protein L25 [Planctomycetia bacterium]
MSALEVLEVKVRDTFGKRRVRRLRANGWIPAILYGHGQEVVNLSIPEKNLMTLMRHGHHIVNLSGEANGEALVKEVQWDVWGKEILHVDFTRINANEKIQLTVPVVLRGEAAGLKEGGVVDQLVHEVEVECSASNTPDEVVVRVSDLALGQNITVADVELPAEVKMLLPAETVLVQCHEKVEVEIELAAEVTGAEPEVIARKKETEEEE